MGKTRVRLKDLGNKAVNEDLNKIIPWMTEDIHASLKYKRENDKEFKKQSARNKMNNVDGAKGKLVIDKDRSHL